MVAKIPSSNRMMISYEKARVEGTVKAAVVAVTEKDATMVDRREKDSNDDASVGRRIGNSPQHRSCATEERSTNGRCKPLRSAFARSAPTRSASMSTLERQSSYRRSYSRQQHQQRLSFSRRRRRHVRFAVDEDNRIKTDENAIDKIPQFYHEDLHWTRREVSRRIQRCMRLGSDYAALDHGILVRSTLHLYGFVMKDPDEEDEECDSVEDDFEEEEEHESDSESDVDTHASTDSENERGSDGEDEDDDDEDKDDEEYYRHVQLDDDLAVQLLTESGARGLERIMSPVVRDYRTWASQSILKKHKKLREKATCTTTKKSTRESQQNVVDALRKRSLKLSQRCRDFALKIAEGDAIVARAIHDEK